MSFEFQERITFALNRLRERLWARPVAICILSLGSVFVAKLLDPTNFLSNIPHVSADSVASLLSIMAASMLVIATFAVASMISAYASASNSATPRSFALIIADDSSQNALAGFVGAFIFSIVGLTAVKNDYYHHTGLTILYSFTIIVFAIVILMFLRWVDKIARLGRVSETIKKVETATAAALQKRAKAPTLFGAEAKPVQLGEVAIFSDQVGYVKRVDVAALQQWAEECNARLRVAALPGAFVAPGRPLVYVQSGSNPLEEDKVVASFTIGRERIYDDDPRFGFVALSEIAGRALSPGINDPGTAIEVLGAIVRLMVLWNPPLPETSGSEQKYDRIEVPRITVADAFDDAFTAIERDGAGIIEVEMRLHKALASLAATSHPELRNASKRHAHKALACAEKAMTQPTDLAAVRAAANWSHDG